MLGRPAAARLLPSQQPPVGKNSKLSPRVWPQDWTSLQRVWLAELRILGARPKPPCNSMLMPSRVLICAKMVAIFCSHQSCCSRLSMRILNRIVQVSGTMFTAPPPFTNPGLIVMPCCWPLRSSRAQVKFAMARIALWPRWCSRPAWAALPLVTTEKLPLPLRAPAKLPSAKEGS